MTSPAQMLTSPLSGGVVPRPRMVSHRMHLPEPRPPKTALYRAGRSSGSKTRAVGIFRIDNDALDAVNQFKGAVIVIGKGLHRLAPAAIEDRGRCRDARRGRRVLCPHHADKHIDR